MTVRSVAVILISLFSAAAVMQCADAATEESPIAYRDQAYSKVTVAMELVEQARDMLKSGQERESVKAAMRLYANAGQLFEEALSIFQALGPDYVTEQDVKGCAQAMRECLDAVNRCKEILTQ